MAWVFNKTLWVPNSAPYITSDQLNRMEKGIDNGLPKLVAALPAGPEDGQEVYFQTAAMLAAGVAPYHVRYNAASPMPHKWEVMGASPWTKTVAGPLDNVAVTQWQTTAAGLNAPCNGVFSVELGGMFFQVGVTNSQGVVALGQNGAAVSPFANLYNTSNTAMQEMAYSRADVTLVAGDVLSWAYYNYAYLHSWRMDNPWLTIQPLRIS